MLFSAIAGQDTVKQKLIETVKNERVSHAQLFLGPEGSGKLALAVAYAQYINCLDPEKFSRNDSCGVCLSCKKYQKLIHPDFYFVFPIPSGKRENSSGSDGEPVSRDYMTEWRNLFLQNQGYISSDQWNNELELENKQVSIRTAECNDIIHLLSYTTYESDYKIMIIWLVEKLFHAAAPKLLKILEEPPEKTIFLLVSENHHEILPTIISRTQLVKIPKLSDQEMLDFCINGCNLSPDRATQIARIADGNLIEAKRLISESEEEHSNFNTFRNWMRVCFQTLEKSKVSELMKNIDQIKQIGRERQKALLQYGLKVVRNALLINLNLSSMVRLNDEESEFIRSFSAFVHEDNSPKLNEAFNNAISQIERNAIASMVFMDLSLQISALLKKKTIQ